MLDEVLKPILVAGNVTAKPEAINLAVDKFFFAGLTMTNRYLIGPVPTRRSDLL
jgi:hypothetical protein